MKSTTEQSVQGSVVKIEIQDDSANLKVTKNEQILEGSAKTIKIETETKRSLNGQTLNVILVAKYSRILETLFII